MFYIVYIYLFFIGYNFLYRYIYKYKNIIAFIGWKKTGTFIQPEYDLQNIFGFFSKDFLLFFSFHLFFKTWSRFFLLLHVFCTRPRTSLKLNRRLSLAYAFLSRYKPSQEKINITNKKIKTNTFKAYKDTRTRSFTAHMHARAYTRTGVRPRGSRG